MGRIYDQFGRLAYANEAEVSLRFTVPLLITLGFSKNEIIPEHQFPSRELFYGIRSFSSKKLPKSQRPDYVVCLNGDVLKACFVVDSKGPREKFDDHFNQLQSYSLGAKVNLLVITNGKELAIYYGQDEIVKLQSPDEIDVFFDVISKLLCRESHLKKKTFEIIRELSAEDIEATRKQLLEGSKLRIRVELSDYAAYLNNLKIELENWHNVNTFAESLGTNRISPTNLHVLKTCNINKEQHQDKTYDSEAVLKLGSRIKVVFGQSGIGKTTLLRFWAYSQACRCADFVDSMIPVFVELRNYGLNRDIKTLILNSLNKSPNVYTEETLSYDLSRKRFIFFLDAFDEIAQNYQSDALSEIVDFSDIYPTHKLIISSRTRQRPRIPTALSFEILPLRWEKIELIAHSSLGPRKSEFLNQLCQLGLSNDMSNTLLLLLAIQIFRSQGKIPATRIKIIDNAVAGLERWADSKSPVMQTKISWKAKLNILRKIAYAIKEGNYGSNLPETHLSSVLTKNLEAMEKAREIPPGYDIEMVLKELSTTGFVHIGEYGLSFNTTMFLNYFAATELGELYEESEDIINDKIDKLVWHEVLIIAASKSDDPTNLLNRIYQQENALKAAACIIENDRINDDILANILVDLERLCSSQFPTVRHRSLYYLARINRKFTREIFERLAESSFDGVKMVALEELSRDADPQAARIVYENFGWDKGCFEIGRTTQGVIARALANLDSEESHLNILEIWKRKVDVFTTEDCRLAMLQLVYSKEVTSKIRDSLLDFYLSDPPEKDVSFHSKLRGIADVFIALEDESIATKLIQGLTDNDENWTSRLETPRILSSFKSPVIFKTLVRGSLDLEKPPLVRVALIEALVQARYFKLELSLIQKLLSDSEPIVKRAAIKGLSKYSSYEVKDMLVELINDPDICSEATELMGDFDLLTNICEKGRFPKVFCPRTLFEQVRKHALSEFLPFLDELQKAWLSNQEKQRKERLLIDLAHTCVILGERDQALQIVDSFCVNNEFRFTDAYAYVDLMELCPILGGPGGLRILTQTYKTIENSRKDQSVPRIFEGIYIDENYIENLERMGGEEVVEILTVFCQEHCNDDILFERAMRAIVRLSPRSKENWLIQLLEEQPHLKGPSLHRAIEALGVIGTEKVLPLLRKLANLNTGNEYIMDTCLVAAEELYMREGKVKFLDDRDMLQPNQ